MVTKKMITAAPGQDTDNLIMTPIPYHLYNEAYDRLRCIAADMRTFDEDHADAAEKDNLADAMLFAWDGRMSIKGRPPIILVTRGQLTDLSMYAEDLLDFVASEYDIAIKNCARSFLDKYHAFVRRGTPMTGHTKGKKSARRQVDSAFVEEIENIAEDTIARCAAVSREVFGNAPARQDMKVLYRYSPKIRISRGGNHKFRPWMSLAFYRYYSYWLSEQKGMLVEGVRFNEYRSFSNDPVIGSVQSSDWRDAVRTLVAHEYAHVVQSDAGLWNNKYTLDRAPLLKAHGDGWRAIYAAFRKRIINDRVQCIGSKNIKAYNQREEV